MNILDLLDFKSAQTYSVDNLDDEIASVKDLPTSEAEFPFIEGNGSLQQSLLNEDFPDDNSDATYSIEENLPVDNKISAQETPNLIEAGTVNPLERPLGIGTLVYALPASDIATEGAIAEWTEISPVEVVPVFIGTGAAEGLSEAELYQSIFPKLIEDSNAEFIEAQDDKIMSSDNLDKAEEDATPKSVTPNFYKITGLYKQLSDRAINRLKTNPRKYIPTTIKRINGGAMLQMLFEDNPHNKISTRDLSAEVWSAIGQNLLDTTIKESINLGLGLLKDVGFDLTFYGDEITRMMNGGTFSMGGLKEALKKGQAAKTNNLKAKEVLPSTPELHKININTIFPKTTVDTPTLDVEPSVYGSHDLNRNVGILLSAGPDLYSNMYDISIVSQEDNDIAWAAFIRKNKRIYGKDSITVSQKALINRDFRFDLSVRNSSISIPTKQLETFSINFLESSLDIPTSKVKFDTTGSLTIDMDYNLDILNFFQHLAGHHLNGLEGGEVAENNNKYKIQFASLDNSGKFDIVVPSSSFSLLHDKDYNPYRESNGTSNIFYRFVNVKFLGAEGAIEYKRDNSDIVSVTIPFIFKDLETIYKSDTGSELAVMKHGTDADEPPKVIIMDQKVIKGEEIEVPAYDTDVLANLSKENENLNNQIAQLQSDIQDAANTASKEVDWTDTNSINAFYAKQKAKSDELDRLRDQRDKNDATIAEEEAKTTTQKQPDRFIPVLDLSSDIFVESKVKSVNDKKEDKE